MTKEEKIRITEISKGFFEGFKPEITEIAGTGWIVVDPLSGFLNSMGFKHELKQLIPKDGRPLILVMVFEDEIFFVPAGSDLGLSGCGDWLWLDEFAEDEPDK